MKVPPTSEPENTVSENSTPTNGPENNKEQASEKSPASTNQSPSKVGGSTSGLKPKEQSSKRKSQTDKKAKSKLALFSLVFAMIAILACGALGSAAYLFWEKQRELEATLNTQDSHNSQQDLALEALTEQRKQIDRLIEETNTKLLNTISNNQKQIERFSDSLNEIKGSTRKDWLLAEAEYLMRVANQRLAIEQDPTASQSLLGAADDVLSELSDPSLMPVRIKIAEELLQLRSVSNKSIDKALLSLSALGNSVDLIDFSEQAKRPVPSKSTKQINVTEQDETELDLGIWQRFVRYVSAAFEKAVHIRRLDEKYTAPPSPEFGEYIKQNLSLRLEQGKLLLMRHQFQTFKNDILNTQTWLMKNISASSLEIQAISDELIRLSQIEFNEQKIDISGSLSLLKKQIELKYRDHTLSQNLEPSDSLQSEKQTNEATK